MGDVIKMKKEPSEDRVKHLVDMADKIETMLRDSGSPREALHTLIIVHSGILAAQLIAEGLALADRILDSHKLAVLDILSNNGFK